MHNYSKAEWKELLQELLLETLQDLQKNGETPARAYALARDLGEALLAGVDLGGHSLLERRLLLPALKHLAILAQAVFRDVNKLAQRWEEVEEDMALVEEAQALIQTVHNMLCAWKAIADSHWETDGQAERESAMNRANEELEKIKRLMAEPDASPILASSWQWLKDLRERFPEDSEVRYWWHLDPHGIAAEAYAVATAAPGKETRQLLASLASRKRRKK